MSLLAHRLACKGAVVCWGSAGTAENCTGVDVKV